MNKPFIENKIIFVWKYKEKRRSVSYYSLLGIWEIHCTKRIIGKNARAPIGRGLLLICCTSLPELLTG